MSPAILFQVDPLSGVPIYRQLMDQAQLQIATRRLAPGSYLPSVRQVSEALRINPMTVSKAWANLERAGVIEHIRGQGMRVCESTQVPADASALAPLINTLVTTALQLGISREVLQHAIDDRFAQQPPSGNNS